MEDKEKIEERTIYIIDESESSIDYFNNIDLTQLEFGGWL